jgi:hypothetical protein
MSAAELLAKVKAAYAGMDHYADEGSVDTHFFDAAGKLEKNRSLKPFKTRFRRGHYFKFEFAEQTFFGPRKRYVVYTDFKSARSWWAVTSKTEENPKLMRILAPLGGVSESASELVPSLLMPEEALPSPLSSQDADCDGPWDKDGQASYRLWVCRGSREVRCYWIDAQSFLLRKVETESIFGDESREEARRLSGKIKARLGRGIPEISFQDFRTRSVSTYVPDLGPAVEDSKISFDPYEFNQESP